MMEKASRACILALRLLALGATAVATIVMVTSHEKTTIFNITLSAKFQHTPAFKFFVIANSIGAAYSLLTLFVPPASYLSRMILSFDVVITLLLTAAISASTAIGEVGKHGNRHTGWLPICGQVHKFCDQVTGAIICGFIGAVVYLAILLHTIHKFNKLLS